MFTDTHAHLDFPDFQTDLDDVIQRAAQVGVHRIITIGTTIAGCRRSLELADKYAPIVYAAVGIHPNETEELEDDWLDQLTQLAKHPRVVAIGECGLDYHRPPVSDPALSPLAALGASSTEEVEATMRLMQWKEKQAYVFRMQLELAAEMGLNVIIHQRDSWQDCLSVLDDAAPSVRGVFHCFGGTESQARELLERGHMMSFTGIVTFKNAEGVRDVVKMLPENAFMVETDCPYLAPVPHRGERCEPAFVTHVAGKIAEIRGLSREEVSRITEQNATRFFRFSAG